MTDIEKTSVRSAAASRWSSFTVMVPGLLIAVVMVYALVTGGRLAERHAPLVDSMIEAKLEVTLSHLWLEELLAGETERDIARVLAELERASAHARSILEGGENNIGVISPVRDPALRSEIKGLVERISEILVVTEQRLAAPEGSRARADADREYHVLFDGVLAQANLAELALRRSMANAVFDFRGVQAMLILACIGVTAVAGFRSRRHDRQQQQFLDALRESEHVLLESQRMAQVGSYVFHFQLGTWESSPVLDDIFGIGEDYPRTEESGLALIHSDDREWAADCISDGGLSGREYRIVRACDASERWVLGRARFEFDAHAQPVRVIGTVQDRTTAKQAEVERDRLMAAVGQAAEGFVVTDPAGTIQYVNPAFEEVTGYTDGEAIGLHTRVLKSGQQPAQFYEEMWDSLRNSDVWRGRVVNKKKDGTFFTEDMVISPVRDAASRIVNYVAVKRDVTRELALEEQLQQAQKIESLGRLAGGVAHDFNNMLLVILGHVELALAEEGLPPSFYDDLREIQAAAERSASLTRQLLAFSRKQVAAPRVLDLNDTVEGAVSMLRRMIGENVELAWLPGEDVWPIRVDPAQVDQILANLCLNARDAIDGEGRISVETRNTSSYETDHDDYPLEAVGEYVMLTVADDGCGMDEATLKMAFEPFFTTKEVGKGTGLGLATVHGIVGQSAGFVQLHSALDVGTTVRIYLPRHVGKADAESEQSTSAPGSQGNETILLVEDESAIITMVKRRLQRLGYVVLAASAAEEALQVAGEHRGEIDLLLTDVVMPGMDGRALAELLLASNPELTCLFMSGYAVDLATQGEPAGPAANHIEKPFSMRDLAVRVREALDSG